LHEILPVEGAVSGNGGGKAWEGADSPFTLLDIGRVTRESLRELYTGRPDGISVKMRVRM